MTILRQYWSLNLQLNNVSTCLRKKKSVCRELSLLSGNIQLTFFVKPNFSESNKFIKMEIKMRRQTKATTIAIAIMMSTADSNYDEHILISTALIPLEGHTPGTEAVGRRMARRRGQERVILKRKSCLRSVVMQSKSKKSREGET